MSDGGVKHSSAKEDENGWETRVQESRSRLMVGNPGAAQRHFGALDALSDARANALRRQIVFGRYQRIEPEDDRWFACAQCWRSLRTDDLWLMVYERTGEGLQQLGSLCAECVDVVRSRQSQPRQLVMGMA